MTDNRWDHGALCTPATADLFHDIHRTSAQVLARQLCAPCPVQSACRKAAVSRPPQMQLAGGLWFDGKRRPVDLLAPKRTSKREGAAA